MGWQEMSRITLAWLSVAGLLLTLGLLIRWEHTHTHTHRWEGIIALFIPSLLSSHAS